VFGCDLVRSSYFRSLEATVWEQCLIRVNIELVNSIFNAIVAHCYHMINSLSWKLGSSTHYYFSLFRSYHSNCGPRSHSILTVPTSR